MSKRNRNRANLWMRSGAIALLSIVMSIQATSALQDGGGFELSALVASCDSEPSSPPLLSDAPECEPAVGVVITMYTAVGAIDDCVTVATSGPDDYGVCTIVVPLDTEIDVLQDVPVGYTTESNPVSLTTPAEGDEPGEPPVAGFVNIRVAGVPVETPLAEGPDIDGELPTQLPNTGIGPSSGGDSIALGIALGVAGALSLAATMRLRRRLTTS